VLVYSETKRIFLEDVRSNRIHTRILENMKKNLFHAAAQNEISSWRNSMHFMSDVLEDHDIPDDVTVSVEYQIPMTSKRVDVIVSGMDKGKKESAVIIELKQWSDVERTDKDGIVKTFLNGGIREVSHPSYQAWSYEQLLKDFNVEVREKGIELASCTYLHNLDSATVIKDDFYREHIERAPAFISSDTEALASFIKQYVKYGNAKTMYYIENSKLMPSKDLADSLVSLLAGNDEFTMIDEQKIVYETAKSLARAAQSGEKQVLIVEGGPGTGKSVVAINLIVEFTKQKLLTQYVSKNSAPRNVYTAKLAGHMPVGRIRNLFKGSGSFVHSAMNQFDVLVVDEAHRLNEKSGFYGTDGENQIKELINASRLSIFFIDEDQRVTFSDIGRKVDIRGHAAHLGATVTELELQSQFRCNGSDGYLSWIDDALGIRETANKTLDHDAYSVRIFDDPNVMRDEIRNLNKERNRARIVAGYCWNWNSRNNSNVKDIEIPQFNFEAQWNLSGDNTWIMSEGSVEQVGCIHTSQGLELDHIAVIVGEDLIVRDGRILTQPEKRARTDASLKGYKQLLAVKPESAKARADAIIKNTYRTLMTRGSKSCFIYCVDPETQEYFRNRISAGA
jgi:DUF2075 family protein/DNA replication protein DnaC